MSTKPAAGQTALFSDEEVTVLSGSRAIADGDFNTNYARSLRDKLIEKGSLRKTEDGRFFVFTEDVPFPAPSTAAAVIFDRNSNGRTAWKVKTTGQTLKEWQNSQLPNISSELDNE